MIDQRSNIARVPLAERIAMAALLLNLAALLGWAVCLAALVLGDTLFAFTAGGIALVTLTATMAGSLLDARLREKRSRS
jgi:hypothetical protein